MLLKLAGFHKNCSSFGQHISFHSFFWASSNYNLKITSLLTEKNKPSDKTCESNPFPVAQVS